MYFLGGKDKADAYDNGKAGIFVNYADYLKYMPNYCAIGEKDPQLWAACKNEDGSIYSLSQYSATSTRESAVIFARTDMLDEAGYSVPTTTDEFMQAIQGLQKFYGEKDSNFVAFQPYNAGHMDNAENAFFPAFGDAVDPGFGLDSEGKVTYNYISDQYKHYLEFMSEVYGSGAFDTNIYTEDGTNAKAKIQSNQTAFTTFGTCLTMDQFKSGHYDVIALEPLTSQYTDTKKFPYRPLTNFIGMMISSDCKDVETLVKWVDTLYTPEDKAINGFWGISMWWGIKGEQWDYTSDDKTTYTIYPPEGMTSSQFLHDIWGTGNVIYCDVFKAVTVGAGNEGLGCKGTYTVQNLWPYSVDVFPEMLLTFTEEEQDIVANKLSAIKTYVAAEKAKFIAGARSLDTWDSFVSDVKSMGIDDVIAAYNAAYARYLQLIND